MGFLVKLWLTVDKIGRIVSEDVFWSNMIEIGGWMKFWTRLTINKLGQSLGNEGFFFLIFDAQIWLIQHSIGIN